MTITNGELRETSADGVHQADDPAVPNPPESVYCKAGHANIAGTRNCTVCGLWLPRNPAAMTSGLKVSSALIPGYDRLHAEVARFLSAALADEPADLSERRRSLIEYRARLHRLIVVLDTTLAHKGITDRRGKLRTQWIASFGSLIARARSLDLALGGLRWTTGDPFDCSITEYAARYQPQEEEHHADDTPANTIAAAEDPVAATTPAGVAVVPND